MDPNSPSKDIEVFGSNKRHEVLGWVKKVGPTKDMRLLGPSKNMTFQEGKGPSKNMTFQEGKHKDGSINEE